jgi:predicted oxidoreductase (fatty acid repression mutant protein)
MEFISALQNRRSVYALGKELPISQEKIETLVKEITDAVPSAFNAQSQRVVVLSGEAHKKLWEITKNTLKPLVGAERWKKTEEKLNGFEAGAGTILFFDDAPTTLKLVKAFPAYAANFAPWAEQQNGMLQLAIWTALEAEGLGVNIQHYNPLIDVEVHTTWKLPLGWTLRAEMVYGGKLANPEPRDHQKIEERVLAYSK